VKIACPDRAFSSSGFGILEDVGKAAGIYRSNFLSGIFLSHYEGVVLKDEMIAGMAFFSVSFFGLGHLAFLFTILWAMSSWGGRKLDMLSKVRKRRCNYFRPILFHFYIFPPP